MVSTEEMPVLACELDENESFNDWVGQLMDAADSPELPPECQRCGHEFGGFAVLIGNRHVCSHCEQDEYFDYAQDIDGWLEMQYDNDFEQRREEIRESF